LKFYKNEKNESAEVYYLKIKLDTDLKIIMYHSNNYVFYKGQS